MTLVVYSHSSSNATEIDGTYCWLIFGRETSSSRTLSIIYLNNIVQVDLPVGAMLHTSKGKYRPTNQT